MKALGLIVLFLASAAQATGGEKWTCSYPLPVRTALLRFEVRPPELIEIKTGEKYWLLEDNAFVLVAVQSFSGMEQGQQRPTRGISTVVIDKATGEFWLVATGAGQPNQPAQGTCLKD